MPQIITTNIGIDYCSDWTIQDALREIYQNFLDYGEFNEAGMIDDGNANFMRVTLSNSARLNLQILRMGYSAKYENSRGKHGEGLKMAMLVLEREEGCYCIIDCNSTRISPYFKDTEIGECLAFSIHTRLPIVGTAVTFVVPKTQFELFKNTLQLTHKVLYSNSSGAIIAAEPGTIFVGGLYVCKMDNFAYAYNFEPHTIELDRDRRIPSEFDVSYHASQICEDYPDLSPDALTKADCRYVNYFSKETIKNLNVKVSTYNNQPALVINDSLIVGRNKEALLKNETLRKKFSKLQVQLSRRRSPQALLKEFKDSHYSNLSSKAKTDFDLIYARSANWRHQTEVKK